MLAYLSLDTSKANLTEQRIPLRRALEDLIKKEFILPSLTYENISSREEKFRELQEGLNFKKINVLRDNELIDIIDIIQYDPTLFETRVYNTVLENKEDPYIYTIEEWQKRTGDTVLINNAQYRADLYYHPCALMICNGKQIGPKKNKSVRAMLVAEPTDSSLPLADILDFRYDSQNYSQYQQGLQHWPVILDREGNVRVKETDWQANRTVIAKQKDGKILFLKTEGGFFTLYNLGRFLRDETSLDIETAMNLDGGYESQIIINHPNFRFIRYGEFETYGPDENVSISGAKYKIPSVIGIKSRNKH